MGTGPEDGVMFAALWLPNFRLQAACRWRETSGAVAVVDGDANRGVLLEVNAVALESRVPPGLTPAQALARCPQLTIVSRSVAQESACQALLVEIALGFGPRVEATAEGRCTLDLSTAPKGACWQRLAEEMVARAAAEGFEVRVGIAPHPDHAWLAACSSDGRLGETSLPSEGRDGTPCRSTSVHVVYDGAPFCAALPMATLEPSPELGSILTDWGIRTIGEFLRLPAKGAIERLGPEAAELRRRASGRTRRVLRLVQPPERYAEAVDFDYAIETTEPLLFLLRRFSDRLSSRLRSGHRVAAALTLTLPMDRGPEYARTFGIPSPTADADTWFRVLSMHLESLTLEQQPVGVRLEVFAENAGGRQLHLFESALRDPNRFGETLAQLKALVGEDGVGVPQPAYTHEPGAFCVEEFAEINGESAPERTRGLPLRRYRPGRPVAVKMAHERPTWIERLGPVTRAAGPYRVSGDWWESRAWWVEEWDVELADGSALRLAGRAGRRWTVEGAYEVC